MRPRKVTHSLERSNGVTVVELLVALVILGILATLATRVTLYALDLARLSKTVASLRIVSDAVLKFEAENDDIPSGYAKVADLESLLSPYVRALPKVDGWGHDLYYESVVAGGDGDEEGDDGGGDGDDDVDSQPDDPPHHGCECSNWKSWSEEQWSDCGNDCCNSGFPTCDGENSGHGSERSRDHGDGEGVDDEDLARPNFRVYSYGKDGTPDGDIVTGHWVDFTSDVVVEWGNFIQTKW